MRMIHMKKTAAAALMGLLLITGLHSQSVPQNVLDTLNEQSDLGAAVLSDLTRSSNTRSGQPAEFLVDGNDSSWYGFQTGSTYGWVRLDFEAPVYLEKLDLRGFLPAESLLYLQTEKNGELVTLPAGYLMGEGNDFTLDLSRDRQVAENLIIRLQGSDLGPAVLSELTLLATPVDGDLHKKELTPRETNYSKKQLNNHYPLVDGLIGTVWTNENTGFKSMIYWLYDNEIQSGYHGNRPWTKEDTIVLDLEEPVTGEFLKFYLTDEGSGILALEASVEDEWLHLADYDLNTGSGWQRVELSGLGEIEAVRLIMSDPSQPWQPGFYGGIGEVEFWSRQNRPDSYLKDLIPPSFDFTVKDSLFTLDEKEEKEYVIRTVTDNLLGEAPVLFINSHQLTTDKKLTKDNTLIWDFTVEEHLLLNGENSLTFQTDDQILSSHLLISEAEGLKISNSSLSDGLRYTGDDFAEDYLEADLYDGRAEAEEITLYYDQYAPGDLTVSRDGNQTSLSPDQTFSGKLVYWLTRFLDKIGISYPASLREAVVKGSPDEILHPSIELLFPLDTIELPNYVAGHYKVIGITDTPDGEITVNGVTAQVRDNYFWVEMRDLGLQTEGTYLLEAKVVHPNGNEAYHRANILMETQSSDISLNQEDRFYTTSDDTFTLSGQVTGSGRDFKINNQLISLPWSGQFNENVPLEEGLNIIRAELYDGDTLVKRLTRQVYRQSIEPNLTILTPSPDSMTNQDAIGITGLVSPWGLEQVTVNGLEAQATGGSFSIANVPLPSETNILRVQALYETGLVSEKSLTVYKDQIAPVISGVTPDPDTPVKYDSILVSGYVEEDNQATVFINGLIAPVIGGTFSLDVPLPVEGNNLIRISAQDEAGNTADWPPFNVFKDTFGPEPFDIVMTPEGWTSDVRPVIEFQTIDTGIGMGHYEVSVNGGAFVTQESPYRLPRLPDGEIRIVVRALDLFDNYTDEETTAYVDTKAPDEAGDFRAAPGSDRVLLRWNEDDDESLSYIVGKEGTDETKTVGRIEGLPEGDILDVLYFEEAWEGLDTGDTYRFSIQAVDRAGNKGNKIWTDTETGTQTVELERNGPTILEYDGFEVRIPQGCLDEEVEKVTIKESADSLSTITSTNPVIGPVYDLSVETEEGYADHYHFDSPFIGTVSYDKDDLPAGVEERQLAVFYFDEEWERWFKTESNYINPEKGTITFATDHFTEFTVQPTMAENVDYRRWEELDYPITPETTAHTPFSISPQSGSASTVMTEIVLPGLNGLDLTIARNYSSTVADSDSTLLPANDRSIYSSYFSLKPKLDFAGYLSSSSSHITTWKQSQRKTMLDSRVELGLALGQGWRLDLPYIKYGDDYVMVSIPGQGNLMTREMRKTKDGNDFVFTDFLEGRGTVRIVMEKGSQILSNGFVRNIKRVEAVTKDGTTYVFSAIGQIQEVYDILGNKISYEYDGLKMMKITDTRQREVRFTYAEGSEYDVFLPLITDIDVYAPGASTPDYHMEYRYDLEDKAGLPLLSGTTDIEGRDWNYTYGMQYLQTKYTARDTELEHEYIRDDNGNIIDQITTEVEVPAYYPDHMKSQYIFPLTEIDGPGVGIERVNYGSNQMARSEGNLDYAALYNEFRRMGSDREMAAEIQFLAVKRLETFDDPSRSEEHLKKNTDYSYGINDDHIVSSAVSDGRRRDLYSYADWSYEWDEEYETIIYSNVGHEHRDSYDIKRKSESVLENAHTIQVLRNGGWETAETRTKGYHGSMKLPQIETVKRGTSGSTVTSTTSYVYDGWANPIKTTRAQSNSQTASTRTDYRWYNTGSPTLPSGATFTESPLEASTLNSKIKDRLLRSYTTTVTTGVIDRTEAPGETVYQYDTHGNMTAKADLTAPGEWALSRYAYDEQGRLTQQTSPLGQITDIAYDYDTLPIDLITTTERDVELADGTVTDRVSSREEDKITGYLYKDTRADGEETLYTRDKLGRITQVTGIKETHETAAPVITIDYDDITMTVTQTDPLGAKSFYDFNNRGEIETIVKNDSANVELQRTNITQDYYGNVSQVETPAGDILTYTYDGMGRVISESYTEENQPRTVTYDYLPHTNKVLRTDEEGYRTLTHRDSQGRNIIIQNLDEREYVIREERYYYSASGLLLAQKDGREQRTYYTYDPMGRTVATESPEASFYQDGNEITGTLYATSEYNDAGQVTREASYIKTVANDILLNEKLLAYDTLGRLVTETVPYAGNDGVTENAVQTHKYDLLDREVLTIDPRGEEWTKEYTKRGQVSAETTPLNARTEYEYDLKDRVSLLKDPRHTSGAYEDYNGILVYHYDDLDRLKAGNLPTRAGEISRTVSFDYDAEGNLTQRTEPDGGKTLYTYTEQNRVKTETRCDADGTITYTTTTAYTPRGNVATVTTPDNGVIAYEYDYRGRKVQETLPEGALLRYSYDGNDNLLKQIDGRGFDTYFRYDYLNRLIKSTDAKGEEWYSYYDGQGNVTKTIDPNNVTRLTEYDQRAQVIKETDGQGLISTYAYDPSGNLLEKLDPRGTTISYTYREDNLPTNVAYNNTGEARDRHLVYTYDEAGALMTADDNGIITTYNSFEGIYKPDPMGQITRRTTANYSDVTYAYDNMDRMTALTNGTNATVSYQYNTLGQLTAMPGYVTDISYNTRGLMDGYTQANGVAMAKTYDQQARPESLDYTNASSLNLKSYSYRWDKTDNLVEENDSLYVYDARNMLSIAMLDSDFVNAEPEEIDPARFGQTDSLRGIDNDVIGEEEMEKLDSTLFQVDHSAQSTGLDLGYPYFVGKIVLNVTESLDHRVTQDNIAVYTAQSNREGEYEQAVIKSYNEALDEYGTGKIEIEIASTVARFIKVTSLFNAREADYTVDEEFIPTLTLDSEDPITVYQLVGGGRNEYYLYDEKGNRIRKTIDVEIEDYSYYPNSDWLWNDGKYTYDYDDNGNRVSKTTKVDSSNENYKEWRYFYDLRNRLEKVERKEYGETDFTTVASYIYDVDGYRIEKTNKDGLKTEYVFDLRGNMIEEIKETGTGFDSSRYIFMGMTNVAKKTDSTTQFYGVNHLGSTTLVTDSDGLSVFDEETTPFGDQEEKGLFYTGKQWDEDAQLYYFNARWYDPETARFITEDPIKDGLLWYAYVSNNPLKFVDPTGLSPRNLTKDQRKVYKASISSVSLGSLPSRLPFRNSPADDGQVYTDCADIAVYMANSAMERSTGEKEFFKNLNRNGTSLTEIVDIHSSDFRDGENFTFYRDSDGNIEKEFSFEGVEVGTIGVFDNHVITVIGKNDDGSLETIQGHTGSTATNNPTIFSQDDLDDYIGTFLGWGEIGKDSADFEVEPELPEIPEDPFDDPFDDK